MADRDELLFHVYPRRLSQRERVFSDSADVALTARVLLNETKSLGFNDLFISTPLKHRDTQHSSQRVSIAI